MNPYVAILRPSVCLLSVLGIIVGGIVAGTLYSMLMIPAIIAVFFITGAGDVINDYFDYKIDKINAPRRPLPSGRIKLNAALKYYALVSATGIGAAFLVSMPFFYIALLNFVVLTLYSWKLKKTALIGNIAVSWLAASTFIAAALITGYSVTAPILVLFLVSFLGALSREILKDVRDIKGDIEGKAKTLPVLIGRKKSEAAGYAVLLLAVISMAIPAVYSMFSYTYFAGALPAAALSIYAMTRPAEKGERLVKIAMYFVFLGFIAGSIF